MSAPIPEGVEPSQEIPEIPEFNLDATLDDPAPVTETAPIVEETSGPNPAWETLKEKLPAEFHSQVDPILAEWDKGVQQKFQQNAEELRKFEAYKQFVDNQVDPQSLLVAHQMAQNLNNDPLKFYNNLSSMLREQGLIQEAKQVEAKAEELEDLEQVSDPRIDKLAQQQEQLLESLRAQREAELREQADARIDKQIADDMAYIESKTGPLPQWAKDEVINRAGLMTQQQQRPVSLREAYVEFQKVRQNMLNTPRPGENAPRVVPGGGGFPAKAPNKEALKSFDGRTAAIAELLNREKSQ